MKPGAYKEKYFKLSIGRYCAQQFKCKFPTIHKWQKEGLLVKH
jgi:hypothetical protein